MKYFRNNHQIRINLFIVAIYLLLFSCIFEKKISRRVAFFGEEYYSEITFKFLPSEPSLDVLFKYPTNEKSCEVYVIRKAFKEILFSFASAKNFEHEPYGYFLYFSGIIGQKEEVNYEDVIAVETFDKLTDSTYYLRLFYKNNSSGKFVELSDSITSYNHQEELAPQYFKTELEGIIYSEMLVGCSDILLTKNKPSIKGCNTRGGKYHEKKFDFISIPEFPKLHVLCLIPDSDSIQSCMMNLSRKVFKEFLFNFISDDFFLKKPYNFVLHLSGFVDQMDEIKHENIKAITTYTIEDGQFSRRFYQRKENEIYFVENPDLNCLVEEMDNEYLLKTTKNLFFAPNSSRSSFINIYDYHDTPRSLPTYNKKSKDMNKPNNSSNIKKR